MKAGILTAHNYVVVFGEDQEGKTVWYNSGHTVKVVKTDYPMGFTKHAADTIVAFYRDKLGADYVKAMKLVEWKKLNNID